MAVKIPTVISILRDQKIDPKILTEIETKLEAVEADSKEERGSAGPKAKNEFVIVVRGDAALKKILQQGWVLNVKEGFDIQTLPEVMKSIAADNNAGQKRKINPLKKWAEFFQHCKRRWLKVKDVHIKTKEPVQIVVLNDEEIEKTTIL